MNWYKTAQQNIMQQYEELIGNQRTPQIIGSGQEETITIPGSSQTITARQLLQQVASRINPILSQNNVTKIDTSPISQANAQGLAISNEPGIIHVDVKKIFDTARTALPAISQTDGIQVDPDIINDVVNKLSQWIEAELLETSSHESLHMNDYSNAYKNNQPFSTVQEAPGEQFGKQIRHQYFPKEFNR